MRESAMTMEQQTHPVPVRRIASIDALRGLVIFTMIYVNDIARVSARIVPPWMRHFHARSGMTLVDLVFPAFLFAMGMSVLLAYLLSDPWPSALDPFGLVGWYSRLAAPNLAHAMARSIGCALVILSLTAGLNRVGFRLKL